MDVTAFLRSLRARLRWVVLLDGVAVLVATLVAVAAGSVLLDWWWRPPGAIRLVLLAVLAVITLTILVRRLARPLATRLADRDLALVAERRLPALDGRLISRVEGIAPPAEDLAAVLTREAVATLVPARRLPRNLLLSGLAIGLVAACVLGAPQHLRDGLTRLLLPLGAHEWTRTSGLDAGVERPVVAADEPVVVDIVRRFGADAPVRLTWTATGSASGESRVLSGLSGPWRQPLNLGIGTWAIRVEGGDAAPARLEVRVVPRPRLERIEAVLTPPAYTRLPAVPLGTLDCTALPGSTLRFTARIATAPGQTLATTLARLGEVDIPTTRDGAALSGSLAVRTAGPLTLAFADTDGIAAEPAPRFTLTLAEDRKPVVGISGPRPKEVVTVRAQVQITVDGGDDLGLADLALTATVSDGGKAPAGERRDLVRFPEVQGLTATTRRCTIDIAALAAPGSTVLLIGRASDANDVTGPGTADSQPIALTIVDEDTLRRDLDRQLAEARDRTTQARTEIIAGLTSPDRLAAAARGAALAAARAQESIDMVVRRWRENRLPDEQAKPMVEAARLLGESRPELERAQQGADAPARAAEESLGKAERLLAGLLSDSDLTRLLAAIIERQRALNQDSRGFVVDHLTKALDTAARSRQGGLVARQQELAAQVKEVERKVLAGSAQLAEAQELVRRSAPAEILGGAAQALASEKERPAAIERQGQALEALARLLDLLRGSDAAVDLAKRAGELANRQETIAKRLEQGVPPGMLAEDQKQLQEDTRRFAEQLTKQPQAAKSARAAASSQQKAEDAMRQGDKPNAQREADSAASLLRDAQRRLAGQDDEQDKKDQEKKKKDGKQDLVAVLKRLHGEQAQVVAEADELHRRLGDKPLDFPAQRSVAELGTRETGLRQALKDEVMAKLAGHPIALIAVQRVDKALERTAGWLAKPALGERGLRMAKVALAELARLIAIAEQKPASSPSQEGDGNKGGGQEGGNNQAPFPPAAELGLLAAMQEEVARVTVTGAPRDVLAGQKEILGLLEMIGSKVRPGSRPQVLLTRAFRAAATATEQLTRSDRGLITRHQQEAAVTALRQLAAESAQNSGGGGGQQQQQQRRDGDAPPADGSPQAAEGGGAQPKGGQQQSGAQQGKAAGTTKGVLIQPERGDLLQLPPELRERLRQAREQPMPPGALPIYERYLELLEGAGK